MSSYHVYPTGDGVDHDTEHDDGCVCGPTPEAVKCDDGSVNWLYLHHSLDGRERQE
jgi:hypothetical protein